MQDNLKHTSIGVVTVTVQERFYTSADLLAMPDDGKRHELENGELLTMNPPVLKHVLIGGKLYALLSTEFLRTLANHARQYKLGNVTGSDGGYRLYTDPETGRETVRVPDVAFVRKEREMKLLNDLYDGAPDLAVEIISPNETYLAIRRKLGEYFTYGVRLVWIVYTDEPRIEVFTALNTAVILDIDGVLDGGEVLPGFTLSVRDLFAVLE